jgi:hypothetical protein
VIIGRQRRVTIELCKEKEYVFPKNWHFKIYIKICFSSVDCLMTLRVSGLYIVDYRLINIGVAFSGMKIIRGKRSNGRKPTAESI